MQSLSGIKQKAFTLLLSPIAVSVSVYLWLKLPCLHIPWCEKPPRISHSITSLTWVNHIQCFCPRRREGWWRTSWTSWYSGQKWRKGAWESPHSQLILNSVEIQTAQGLRGTTWPGKFKGRTQNSDQVVRSLFRLDNTYKKKKTKKTLNIYLDNRAYFRH